MSSRSIALSSYLHLDLGHLFPGHLNGLEEVDKPFREFAWPGIDARRFAALSLMDSILKKFQDDKSDSADEAALTKFLDANARCKGFTKIDEGNLTEIQKIAIGESQKCFYDFWFSRDSGDYWLGIPEIMEGLAVGPGASIGATGTSFYHKVASSCLTTTRESLYSLYSREADRYALESDTELLRKDNYEAYELVEGSVLQFVPKTRDISRTICTEPLLNMMFQKGLAAQFESQLKARFGIDLATQPDKNQRLAKIGSVSGRYGTIDLQSASDTISLGLMRQLVPPYVLGWLLETRSPKVALPGGSLLDLHMVSSMGNAYTFPLQTILFSSIVIGVYKALGIRVRYPRGTSLGNFGVFGDDIIVDREAYDLVCNLLGRFGFLVNHEKSFNEGAFRESCGADYFAGEQVRGIYCTSLKTPQDVYSLINRLNIWSARHDVYLPRTIQYLLTLVKTLPVPMWESDIAGIKVPSSWVTKKFRTPPEYQGSIAYMRYVPRVQEMDLSCIELRSEDFWRTHRVKPNAPGVLLAAVGGYLRDGRVMLRQRSTNYRLARAIAPNWDYVPAVGKRSSTVLIADHVSACRGQLSRDGWQRFNNVVRVNLGS